MNKTIYNIGSIAMLGLPQTIHYFHDSFKRMDELEKQGLSRGEYKEASSYLMIQAVFTGAVIAGQVGVIYKTLEWIIK